MKRSINKKMMLVSLLLLNMLNVWAAHEVKHQEKKPLLSSKKNIVLDKYNTARFWHFLQEQLGNKPYPLPNLKDKAITLILGETGIGKSTYINRLLGHEFEWKDKPIPVRKTKKKPISAPQKNSSNVEELLAIESSGDEVEAEKVLAIAKKKPNTPIALIGNDAVSSCTKIPQIYTLSNGVVLVDCPGFGDSEGVEQEVLNLLMIRLFVEKAAKVCAIMVLLPYSVLNNSGKGQHLLSLARQLDYLVQFEQCVGNILWCFTRCPEDIKRSHIVAKIKEIKQKKSSFKKTLMEKIWDTSEQKKDMTLLEKMLTKENRIRVANPLCGDNEVERIKKVLLLMCKPPIDKKYFDFYHPTLDIKGIVKRFFDAKLAIINNYKTYQAIPEEIVKIIQEIEICEAIIADTNKLKDYTANKIKQFKLEIANLQDKIDHLKKEDEKPKCYRSEQLNLRTRWLNDRKSIIYDDLPFELNDLEEDYDQSKISKKKGIM